MVILYCLRNSYAVYSALTILLSGNPLWNYLHTAVVQSLLVKILPLYIITKRLRLIKKHPVFAVIKGTYKCELNKLRVSVPGPEPKWLAKFFEFRVSLPAPAFDSYVQYVKRLKASLV
jgi:hypothetical protein